MKSLVLAAIAALLLAACSPVLDAYVVKGADPTTVATVWGDNDEMSFTMFTHIDGNHLPSRDWRGYPYSVSVAPGTHVLNFFVRSVGYESSRVRGWNSDIEESFDFEAGHTYAMRHVRRGDKVYVRMEDLGVGVPCRYVQVIGMNQGYSPVDLVCGDETPPAEINAAAEAERAAQSTQSGG
jgi:hypothetical protein